MADSVDLANIGNPAYQGYDEQALVGPASGCTANADVAKEAATGQFALWSGSWTDSVAVRTLRFEKRRYSSTALTIAIGCGGAQSGGYGGSLYLCADSEYEVVQGSYSSIGHVRRAVLVASLLAAGVSPSRFATRCVGRWWARILLASGLSLAGLGAATTTAGFLFACKPTVHSS